MDNPQTREYILTYIKTQKSLNPNYKVIDLGGTVAGWTHEVVDTVVDINSENNEKNISADLCNHHDWHKLLNHIEKNGMYDYAICSHTLEDLYDPIMALKWFPKIARAGMITMPSIRTELSRLEYPWLGYLHHRWIFDQEDGKMFIIPKLGLLEHIVPGMQFNNNVFEILYEWENDIPFKLFMNNYLGPTDQVTLDAYLKLINNIKI